MRDEIYPFESQNFTPDPIEPAGTLKRALYLWERQPPSPSRLHMQSDPLAADRMSPPVDDHIAPQAETSADQLIEEQLKRHAQRLASLERAAPGDRRLDSPRFSLMMLNAFLGRAATEGLGVARLPGLNSICERIDLELSDLELDFPDAHQLSTEEGKADPAPLRDEMRALISDLKSMQKAQQRQIVSSLTALHTSISELRDRLPDRDQLLGPASHVSPQTASPDEAQPVDDLARPLIDSERIRDPRPILAAARAAALRANLETSQSERAPDAGEVANGVTASQSGRPYRSVLLGTAVLGFFMILFGREAVQFLSSAPLLTGANSQP